MPCGFLSYLAFPLYLRKYLGHIDDAIQDATAIGFKESSGHRIILAIAMIMHHKGHEPGVTSWHWVADGMNLLAACGCIGEKRRKETCHLLGVWLAPCEGA